jgi:nucleotide-binding universal stress UspA family protein
MLAMKEAGRGDDATPRFAAWMKVNRAHGRLRSQCERAMLHAAANPQVAVRLGKPVKAIVDAAREWNPDLIVMAAPRRRRIDALIGTTAERVIRATRRPLLLVSAATDRPYSSIVLATDLSPAAT